jgi:hypothetical protein
MEVTSTPSAREEHLSPQENCQSKKPTKLPFTSPLLRPLGSLFPRIAQRATK